MTALAALTERSVQSSLRDLDLPLSMVLPAVTFVGLNLALGSVIDTGGMIYAQYVLPAIVVQAVVASTLTTADRANRDHWSDYADRIRTFPIPAVVPLMARMLYCLLAAPSPGRRNRHRICVRFPNGGRVYVHDGLRCSCADVDAGTVARR